MKILHAISGIDPSNGGPTFALLGLAGAQVQAGLSVQVVATWQREEGPAFAERFRERGVDVTMIGQASGKLSRHPQIQPVLDRLVPSVDVVHIHGLYEEIQVRACRTALRDGKPLVVTPHGLLDRYNMHGNGIAKRIYLRLRLWRSLHHASMIHVATEFEKRNVERLRLTAPCRVEPFGLDLAEFENLPPAGQFRSRFAETGDRQIVLYLGRIQKGKGLEILVPAMARLIASTGVAPTLVIAGPDEGYRATIERLIDTDDLKSHVLFTGMLHGRGRIEALVDADLLAAPSLHENFSMSVAEALAAGRAVVVSDQVGLADLVKTHGLGGVGRVDVDDIATQLARVLNAPDRSAMGERARRVMFSDYRWDRIGQHWVQHYASIAS